MSFSSKIKSYCILIGVALGSFFSHGIAILFGSTISTISNPFFHTLLEFVTYLSFIFFGIVTMLQKNEEKASSSSKSSFLHTISKLPIGYVLMIAFSIAIGELGDKTFLASLGLGIHYSNFKLLLILGAILGMVASDSIAIVFGKWLNHKISDKTMNVLSGVLFLVFGMVGLICNIYVNMV